MSWDSLQWILGVVLFVVFLLVMMRGCGGMTGGMGCCGTGSHRGQRDRRGEYAGHEGMGRGTVRERELGTEPGRRDREDQGGEAERHGQTGRTTE